MSYGRKRQKTTSHCRLQYTVFILHALSENKKFDVETRNRALHTDWTVYELNKYFYQKIFKRAERKGVSREELELVVLDMMRRLIIVPKALYIDKWSDSFKIASRFDPKDTPFIALALKLNIPKWILKKIMISKFLY